MSAKIECVYFIHAEDTNLVKVGWTSDLSKRFDQLQTASPHRLRLLGIHLGNRDVETCYHHDLAPYRQQGEWFFLTREVRRWVKLALENHFESSCAARDFHTARMTSEEVAREHLRWQEVTDAFLGVPGSQPTLTDGFTVEQIIDGTYLGISRNFDETDDSTEAAQ